MNHALSSCAVRCREETYGKRIHRSRARARVASVSSISASASASRKANGAERLAPPPVKATAQKATTGVNVETRTNANAMAIGGSNATVVASCAVVAMAAIARAMVVKTTKTNAPGRNGGAFDVVVGRYAKLVHDSYDIPFIPEAMESALYKEVCKSAYEQAYANFELNLNGAAILGHPLVVTDTLVPNHEPKKSGIKEDELYSFVEEVVGDTRAVPLFLPPALEKKIYTNAVLTGWTVMEDSLQNFKMRLFDTEFVFNIEDEGKEEQDDRRAKPKSSGQGKMDIIPKLSGPALREIAQRELDLPVATRMLPKLEENVSKVAVGMLAEACTMEVKVKDFVMEFALAPASDKDDKAAFENVSFDDIDYLETQRVMKEFINDAIDDFMKSRVAISPVFLPSKIERETYVNLLTGLFGDIGKGPIANVLGFNIGMRMQRRPNRPGKSNGAGAEAKSSTAAATKRRGMGDLFKELGDELRSGEWDKIAVTSRELLGLDTTPFGKPKTASGSRNSKVNRKAIEDFVDYLLADPMYNIKAIPDNIERALYINCFELVADIITTVLADFELDMLGRRIRMDVRNAPPRSVKSLRRFRPDERALREFTKDFSKIEPVREIMCNVYAFILAFMAQTAADFEIIVVGHRLRTAMSTNADASILPSAAKTDALNDLLVQAIETLATEILTVSAAADLNVGGSAEKRSSDEVDFDKEIYRLFETSSSKPDAKFPFPYLNAEQFKNTTDQLIAEIVPGISKYSSKLTAVREISKAADLNGDGVIQWAEWYYAAKAIEKVLTKTKGGNVKA